MIGIELFCGKGIISDTFRAAGHDVISVDIRKLETAGEFKYEVQNAGV
jgi:adenine-specific DNA methylase